MEDETTKKTTQEIEETKENTEHPDDKISRANAAAERMEAANQKHEELLNKQENMQVNETLGGKAAAGTPPEKKEESPEDYTAKVMNGEVEAKDEKE